MSRRKRGGRQQRPHSHRHEAGSPDIVLPVKTEDQMRLELTPDPIPSALEVELTHDEPAAANAAYEPAARVTQRASTAPAPGTGARLRAAREARELTADDVARQLRIPVAVVRALEAEQFEQLGPPVYTRGYLKSYARMVALPESALEPALERLIEPPVLVATHTVAPARYFASRFSTPLLYALLTLFVVVPALSFVYQRAQLPQREPKLERLDAAADEVPAAATSVETVATPAPADTPPASEPPSAPAPQPAAVVAVQPLPDAQQPVMASLAPMASAETPRKLGAQRVMLKLAESSWVELVGTDGSRIEYAMLPSGTTREYQIAGKAMLRIGNIRGARLEVDGHAVDLQPFARANVARVFLGDGPVGSAQ